MDIEVKNLHPLEVRLLRHVDLGQDITAQRLVDELDYKIGQCNQAFSWLTAKGCIEEKSRDRYTLFELTETGAQQAVTGLPVEMIFASIRDDGPATLPQLASRLSLQQSDVGSAFGVLTSAKVARMDEEKKATLIADSLPREVLLQHDLIARAKASGVLYEKDLDDDEKAAISKLAKKRGASASTFKQVEKEDVTYVLTAKGAEVKQALLDANITGEEFGLLTPQMLQTGSWKNGTFRPYGLEAPVSRLIPGRTNAYADYLMWVKDKLVSLGFEEFDGPLVVNEFWNGDALFMPQFHSARDIHDVYYIKDPVHCRKIEEPWLSRVAATHENGGDTGSRGWGYTFDHEFTRRQVMRSQGTVLSATQLPHAKVPGKYFGIARCFRYDQVDATHGADFYQTEGIVVGEDVNLRNLLGLLKMFAEEVAGAEEVKYVPGYFPFTEPSIEVHIKHPVLGWFELGGSGIFRPEVTKALGLDVPVLAWGLGIDRMALMHLGLNDLRELFTPDIESVRMRRGN